MRHDIAVWTDDWHPPESYVREIELALRRSGAKVKHGTAFDRWDLAVTRGPWGGARLAVAVEDHGGGSQYLRVGLWPKCATPLLVLLPTLVGLAVAACLAGAWSAGGFLAMVALVFLTLMLWRCTSALGDLVWSIRVVCDHIAPSDPVDSYCNKARAVSTHPGAVPQ
jgi:hypothetical protein